MERHKPYIAKIVDAYRTGNGNYFCREEGQSEQEHHLDWPIFDSAEYSQLIENLPIFGIVATDYNNKFFNGESRLTCRVMNKDRTVLEKIFLKQEMLNNKLNNFNLEDYEKQKSVFGQYIKQYMSTINSTLDILREYKHKAQIPYAQFLFSISEYFGLLFTVAHYGKFEKRNPDNFTNFLTSEYFPATDHCKAKLVWFIRNGIMHQIFPKATGIGTSCEESLFYQNDDKTLILNLDYFDRKLQDAITEFTDDLYTNSIYLNNAHRILIVEHYGFDDQVEFEKEINKSFGGQLEKVVMKCP
jgi:hypothetical protein